MTRQQAHLLHFIRSYHAENDYMPSFDEMRAELGLRSKSGIHRLVKALEEFGFIRRYHYRARAIEVVNLTQPHACPHCGKPLAAERQVA